MQTIQLTSGQLTDYGLSEFEPDHQIKEIDASPGQKKKNPPYQCLPIYLNDDQALDVVKQKAASVDLSGSLYIPNDYQTTNIIWIIFRGHMSWLMQNNMGYTEWRDFATQNDHVLPINFQVGNRNTLTQKQFDEYLVGGYNKYAQSLQTKLSQTFNGEIYLQDQGSKYMRFAFDENTSYNASDSIAIDPNPNNDHKDYTEQKKTAAKQLVTTKVYEGTKLVDTTKKTHECFDITNTIDIFCYNGRIECWFLPGKPWSTYLNQFGDIFNNELFDDQNINDYINNLNDYLDDDYDYDDDLSQYVDNTSIVIDMNQLKYQTTDANTNIYNWLTNILFPHNTINNYQINRLLIFLTVLTWIISMIINTRVGYFNTIIDEKIPIFISALILMPGFSAISRYLWLFTKTDPLDSLMTARLKIKSQFLQWQGSIGLWYVFWNLFSWFLLYESHFIINGASIWTIFPLTLNWGLWIFPKFIIKTMPESLANSYQDWSFIELIIGAIMTWFILSI